ncbi:hypothetical protein Scep_004304 [Stephania cephalantha]|uniref:Uncharacterized protein n=1 Tax=Stephania cephalantha TaxID=152367 RepID=A0AAP0KT51_9MAGN
MPMMKPNANHLLKALHQVVRRVKECKARVHERTIGLAILLFAGVVFQLNELDTWQLANGDKAYKKVVQTYGRQSSKLHTLQINSEKESKKDKSPEYVLIFVSSSLGYNSKRSLDCWSDMVD